MTSGKNTVVTQKGTGQTCSTNAVTTEMADRDRYSYRAEAPRHKDACPKQDSEHAAAGTRIHILPGANRHGVPMALPSRSLNTPK